LAWFKANLEVFFCLCCICSRWRLESILPVTNQLSNEITLVDNLQSRICMNSCKLVRWSSSQIGHKKWGSLWRFKIKEMNEFGFSKLVVRWGEKQRWVIAKLRKKKIQRRNIADRACDGGSFRS
jgi:hypothetical protein